MNYFIKSIKHFKTITKHKLLVMKYCFKLGLYKQGLLHDNSKYSSTEFLSSVKYFSGTRSPIDAEKEDLGYSLCWLHHKGHNPHHWEYWIDDIGDNYHNNTYPKPIEIPINYVLEMVCDWIAAGKVYMKDKWTFSSPYEYYLKMKPYRLIHPNTDLILDKILYMIQETGINYTFYMIKNYFGEYFLPKKDFSIRSYKHYLKLQKKM